MNLNEKEKLNIVLCGAFDVESYGDSLFPLAVRKEFERIDINCDIYLFAPRGKEKSYLTGEYVYSYSELDDFESNNRIDAIIVGGGELLHFGKIEFKSENEERIIYESGEIWELPVKFARERDIPYCLNSVGVPNGFSSSEADLVRELLSDAYYVSVRDKYSYNRLKGVGIENCLVPDSLWRINSYIEKKTHSDGDYIVVQYGTEKDRGILVDQIKLVVERTKYNVIVLSVNYCHDDRLFTEYASKEFLNNERVTVIDGQLGIEDIYNVIANSTLFVGTSMHGVITASANGIPSVIIDMYPGIVGKMDGLVEWSENSIKIISSVSYMFSMVETITNDTKYDLKYVDRIHSLLDEHFKELLNTNSKIDISDIVDYYEYKKGYLTIKDCKGVETEYYSTAVMDNKMFRFEYDIKLVNKSNWAVFKIPLKSASIVKIHKARINDDEIYSSPVVQFEKDLFLAKEASFFLDTTILSEDCKIVIECWINIEVSLSELTYYVNSISGALIEDVGKIDEENNLINVIRLQDKHFCDYSYKMNQMFDRYRNDLLSVSTENIELKKCLIHDEHQISEKDAQISEKDAQISEKERQLNEKETQIREKDLQILRKNNEIEALTGRLSDVNQEILNKNGHIEQLLVQERYLINIKNSKGGKVLQAWWDFKDWLLPRNSKRRALAKIFKKFLRHPVYMLKKCTPSRIKRTLHYINTEDGSQIENRLEAATINAGEKDDIERYKLDLIPVNENIVSIDGLELIGLPKVENPIVSIVIPVYNQFHYTYNCLKSIVEHTTEKNYEVILADDCSTDFTKNIDNVVKNIIISRTPENMRFLKNCNLAASKARGKYILFLNNDTQVLDGWLSNLISVAENDEKVGIVGSKLLYPDGSLQEAGGILWKDGSAWNYGHLRGPLEAEFNYVKEADYISGAAIMVRKSLWEEIGGFDETFAPAYYEDTDLAFEVRNHGYKVIYQPLSMVVHFEGISNGTDTSSGQKEYQIVNQKKFYDKWKDVLKKDHFPNAENVFIAKDRSRYKKQILVVDHYVPHHDKDAGGKCTYMYLKMFVKMGMKVTFIGDNFFPHQPYTEELNQLGIEVLYGNYYYSNWKSWLKENGHFFDYVYLQRPHISIKYIDIVRECCKNAKVFYFAHDLHHIREYREYELTGDKKKLESSEKWKKIEYELFEKADVGHVVGSYEQKVMQDIFPNKPIRNIPLYIYEDMPKEINKDFSTRNDIMYVGGFGHPPNIDAVLWFGKEVFPKVLEKYPTMKWYVIGSKVTPEIQALASDNIIIMGFVSDEKLEEIYRKCRIAVVPLRVGAGVKGKVVESAYYQIPLVTTTIGAEGLDDKVGNMVIEDDSDKMAKEINELYDDTLTLTKMSDSGKIFISKYFTYENAEKVIETDL